MRFPDERMPYAVATNVFDQGIECDHAAYLIRQRLPEFLSKIATEVKEERGSEYMESKEATWLKHLDHGVCSEHNLHWCKEDCEPDDPDCPCRGTENQRQCAYQGCGFCRAAERKKDEENEP